MITQYFADFEKSINSLDIITCTEIIKRKLNDFFGIIEGKITFESGVLDVLEVVRVINNQFTKLKYKYHFRNFENELIFRYDNAEHHTNLATFPHHKHIHGNIIESSEPHITQILFEIKTLMSRT
jgi:hypothetical protein